MLGWGAGCWRVVGVVYPLDHPMGGGWTPVEPREVLGERARRAAVSDARWLRSERRFAVWYLWVWGLGLLWAVPAVLAPWPLLPSMWQVLGGILAGMWVLFGTVGALGELHTLTRRSSRE